jgi:hypothetical protein
MTTGGGPTERSRAVRWLTQVPLWLTLITGVVALADILHDVGPTAVGVSVTFFDRLEGYNPVNLTKRVFDYCGNVPTARAIPVRSTGGGCIVRSVKGLFVPPDGGLLNIFMIIGSYMFWYAVFVTAIAKKHGIRLADVLADMANEFEIKVREVGYAKTVLSIVGAIFGSLLLYIVVLFPLYATIVKYLLMALALVFGIVLSAIVGFVCFAAQFFVGVKLVSDYLEIYHGGKAMKELDIVAAVRRSIKHPPA